ncbi:MAG TPA: DNA polymerase III subunit beta [Gaiellaceae bacterium]|nr:DNA polymerase III subunit beta [Gaiellaceae bacterium]
MIDSETVTLDVLKANVARDLLAEKVGIVSRALSTRASVLVLGGIHLRSAEGMLELAATDMEVSLRATVEAEIGGAGEVVVPGKLLLDITRSLPDGSVSLEYLPEESILLITSGTASYRIHTYSAEDFPHLPEIAEESLQPADRETLLGTIARVSRSASRDESRPVLTGIFVSFEGQKLVMAATDSYRLAVKETPAPSPLPELQAIIPARALQELTRIAGSADSIDLAVQENHVVFGAEGVWLTSRRIDGQFPNYKQLLPEQFEHELELPREELLDVVRRVGLLAQRNSPLRLRFAEGELTVSARTQDVGEAREALPAPYAADAMEIGFNADFLRDGLESIDTETVRVKLISPLRPAVLQGDSPDYTYLIMPIRLAG